MTAEFDVLTQGWIPVLDGEGTLRKVGLREALIDAHRFVEISDPSPMVEYGLYRLLSVFLMDALRPADQETLEDLLESGTFDGEEIDGYIAQCRSEGVSFDLFDPERPFLQMKYVPKMDTKGKPKDDRKPVAVLDYTCPSGNNHTHFDHRKGEKIEISYDEAARLLVPLQIFAPAGGKGYPYSINGQPPYYTLVKGRTLFEMLVYSMRPLDRINISFDDPPVFWRNLEQVEPGTQIAETSWLYGMIFPARKVTLFSEENVVRKIAIDPGLKFVGGEAWRDPFITYQFDEKKGRKALCPDCKVTVWRNLNELINEKEKLAPEVLRQYFELEKQSEEATISLYGAQTEAGKATFLEQFHFDLKIPARLTREERLLDFVTSAIRAAEHMNQTLQGTFFDCSEYPDAPCRKKGRRKYVPPTIPGVSYKDMDDASIRFYERCEQKFWSICGETGKTEEEREKQFLEWCDFLAETAQNVRMEVLVPSRLTGRTLAKVAAHDGDIPKTRKEEKEKWTKGR